MLNLEKDDKRVVNIEKAIQRGDIAALKKELIITRNCTGRIVDCKGVSQGLLEL